MRLRLVHIDCFHGGLSLVHPRQPTKPRCLPAALTSLNRTGPAVARRDSAIVQEFNLHG
jgi:hypothetical protein